MTVGTPAAKGSPEETHERLLVEAAQADPRRFADLYELHFERVYAFIARRVRGREAVEDLTAEVFQKALASLPRFKWTGAPFAAWLFRIASNMIADKAKHAARETGAPENDEVGTTSQTDLERVEQVAQLFRLVDELPDDQRQVIQLRFAAEKSIREIAAEMERSEGAVKQLQFRGLQSLRARLGETNG